MTTIFERRRLEPDALALADAERQLTVDEVVSRLERLVTAIDEEQLTPAARIAVLGENDADTLLMYAAVCLAGRSAVLINYQLTAGEIAFLLSDAGAGALWAGTGFHALATDAANRTNIVLLTAGSDSSWDQRVATIEPRPIDLDRVGANDVIYTSGTTGTPKAVELPRTPPGSVRDRLTAFAKHHSAGMGPHLVCGPLYHAGPHASVGLLLEGTTIVLIGRFDPARALAAIERRRITTTLMVPTHFTRMLQLPDEIRTSADVSSLQRVSHTGSACPPALKRAMIEWFGPILRESYGGSECGILAVIDAAEWLERPGSVGRIRPQFESLVLRPDGTPCSVDEEGVLYFRDLGGHGIAYMNDPEKTEAAHVAPATFTLGDVGRIDADGYLYVTGRVSDMVLSGGVNIYPAEAEQALCRQPGVVDAVAFGVPDDEMGERLVALVVVQPGADLDGGSLRAACRAELAGYKVPKEIRIVATIDRTPMGKVDKRALANAYLSEVPVAESPEGVRHDAPTVATTGEPHDEFLLLADVAEELGLVVDECPAVVRVSVDVGQYAPISALRWNPHHQAEIVLLHGGSQNAHTWDATMLALARPAVAVDLPGHGHSGGGDHSTMQVDDLAAAVAEGIRALAPDAAGIVGMSLGGLTSLALAEIAPELVRRLVLVDVLPTMDTTQARRIVDFVRGPESFPDFDAILAHTMRHNPTRTERSLRRGVLHNAVQRVDGTWIWRHQRGPVGPPTTLAEDDARRQERFERLWTVIDRLTIPMMLVRGMEEHSVLRDEHESELRRRQPTALVARVPGAGHSVQGDRPLELARLIDQFIPARGAGPRNPDGAAT